MNRAICVQFFISGANGIAKHSGEKILCRCPSQPFLPKSLGWPKGHHTNGVFFLEYSTSFDTSVISL